MVIQKSVWIQKKTLDRPCLDNYYRNQHVSDVVKLQNKALRIINISDEDMSTKDLFSYLRILSFDKIVNLQNCFLVLNVLNNEVLEALQEFFKNSTNQHHYNTRTACHNTLNLPQVRTTH